MKYLLLIYSPEEAWAPGERETCIAESVEYGRALRCRGICLDASPLQSVATATCVRIRDGQCLTTSGPSEATPEQLSGYFLVEARDFNDAIQIACRIPGARKGTVEVRPVAEFPVVNSQNRASQHDV